MKKLLRSVFVLSGTGLLCSVLVACASNSTPIAAVLSGLVAERFGSADLALKSAKLKPEYQYLKVDIEGRPSALLVLGYVDPHPDGNVEVWYSARQEVIKTRSGRIVGTTGLEVDWRMVRYEPTPPSWDDASLRLKSTQYSRFRDESPGNRFALADRVELRSLYGDIASKSRPKIDLAPSPAGYQWFNESIIGPKPIPESWYAVGLFQGRTTVVYSKQCLSPSFCLSLTRWPQ